MQSRTIRQDVAPLIGAQAIHDNGRRLGMVTAYRYGGNHTVSKTTVRDNVTGEEITYDWFDVDVLDPRALGQSMTWPSLR